MSGSNQILIGGTDAGEKVYLECAMANRHGLISGATGTGKTVTLQVLAEGFSRLGVPVFTADVKGDLSGIAKSGSEHQRIRERIEKIGIENHSFQGVPTLLWDVFGKTGHPVRTTISEMGPVLLANLLELNETQAGVLHIAFAVADDEGLLLLDLKDLKALLNWLSEHSDEIQEGYGSVSSSSVGAIQRRLLVLSEAGGDVFFGEPALRTENLMQHDFSGKGVVSILDAKSLINNPRIYATFLLWLLSELFEELEEVGDSELPKLVFFFDEAHLLFDNAPKALLQKIEQVVRLIRSRGVSVFFITQHPSDIPDNVLGQLANRVQHALRAFTPKDKLAVSAAAKTFRQNPALDAEEAITQLGVGEALVSMLNLEGSPTIVQRALIVPPESRIGPLTPEERSELLSRSPIKGLYDQSVDRESAYELIKQREELREQKQKEEDAGKAAAKEKQRASRRQTPGEAFIKSVLRSVGSQIGRQITRGILGSITGRR